jgi:LysR family transcriptional regulator, nitrogen assimilation regulatory protein
MDARRLRYFATVAELGSFTKAAERLHVAQPALSRQVRQLEEELGLELFSRIGRHIRATDAGEVLLRHARTIERDFERLIEDMRARRETPNGRVTFGVPPALGDILVPPIVKRVQREYPRISISVAEGISPVLSEWVQNNKVDLAILGLACEGGEDPSPGLRLEVLVSEDMVVIEKPNGAKAPRTYSLARLKAKPLVLSDKFATVVRSQLGGPDLSLSVALEIESVQAIKVMVLQGYAATILPVSMFNKEIRKGTVTASAITAHGVRRQIMLAQPSFRHLTQAAQAVARVIREEIERMRCEGLFSLSCLMNGHALDGKRSGSPLYPAKGRSLGSQRPSSAEHVGGSGPSTASLRTRRRLDLVR